MPDDDYDKQIQEADEAAFDVARIGIDIERFLNTEAGKYLWEKAEKEADAAASDLIFIPAKNHKEIAEAQVRARVAIMFKKFVAEGINSGLAAEKQLRRNDELEQ